MEGDPIQKKGLHSKLTDSVSPPAPLQFPLPYGANRISRTKNEREKSLLKGRCAPAWRNIREKTVISYLPFIRRSWKLPAKTREVNISALEPTRRRTSGRRSHSKKGPSFHRWPNRVESMTFDPKEEHLQGISELPRNRIAERAARSLVSAQTKKLLCPKWKN